MNNILFNAPNQLDPDEEEQLNSTKDYKLNDRQQQFCLEYMLDLNGAAAATRCGYKPFGASHTAYRLLRTTAIKKRLKELKKEQREQTPVSFGFIVNKLLSIAEDALIGEDIYVYDPSIKKWVNTGRKKPDRATALKAYALLGKHIGMFDKDYVKAIEKEEENIQEKQEKQSQLIDAFVDTSVTLKETQDENQRMKAALAEAGIELKPRELTPEEIKNKGHAEACMHNGEMMAMSPSEYDDKPHYKYKRIKPHKNHPEHKLVSEEQMLQAIQEKAKRHLAANTNKPKPRPDV